MAEIMSTTSELGGKERWDHIAARVGYKRAWHRAEPGLYRLGEATANDPVLVTANYTLSFDAVRKSLPGTNAWILVLDTKGVNVWCAAGKRTFGTEELVNRIGSSDLANVVSHRRLILPQLGAPGICAHEVKARTGFQVEYGPVRAEDLPEYLRTGVATEAMRQVRFDVKDRATLVPVELKNYLLYGALAAIALFIIGGWFGLGVFAAAYFGGLFLFPLLLPYLPTKEFSTKGMILGALLSVPLIIWSWYYWPSETISVALIDLAVALSLTGVVAYLALNFTGTTPYASRTGVKREIFRYIPTMVIMAAAGPVIAVINVLAQLGGWY